MNNVYIFGATGMLGSAVTKYFLNNTDAQVTALCRYKSKPVLESYCPGDQIRIFDPSPNHSHTLNLLDITEGDYLLNCIGTIKPHIHKDINAAVYTNSIVPWLLSQHALRTRSRLIHVTTDCIFNGTQGYYNETHNMTQNDVYSHSKFAGELMIRDTAMVLRTSIIGPEVHNNSSLVEWVKQQAHKSINGYTNHFWNGVTTNTYARILHQIIKDNMWTPGMRHIHSPNALSKHDLVLDIIKHFNVEGVTVKPHTDTHYIDRTLSTIYPSVLSAFNIGISSQLSEYNKNDT